MTLLFITRVAYRQRKVHCVLKNDVCCLLAQVDVCLLYIFLFLRIVLINKVEYDHSKSEQFEFSGGSKVQRGSRVGTPCGGDWKAMLRCAAVVGAEQQRASVNSLHRRSHYGRSAIVCRDGVRPN